jgi:predicted nucleotidyltransferase
MNKKSLERELSRIVEISKTYGAGKIVLFGSCIDNVVTARDIDLAVSGINPRHFFKYYGEISMAVDDEVDIIDLDDVREHFYKRILSKGKVIYEREVQRA